MPRLILLSTACGIIFLGVAAIFFLDGYSGVLVSILIILVGSALLWHVERKTVHHLDQPGMFNDVMNADQDDPGP